MLIFSRRFFPFFATQALGAFNDNFYRNGLVMLITFAFASVLGENTGSVVALCPMIFMAPYFLFSATAGHMADYYDKALLVRWLKVSELVIMLIAVAGLWFMHLWLLLIVLFLLGCQAAFYGPVKYAILPALLKENQLVAGNAWVEASTFIVILGGTMASSLLMLSEEGRHWLSAGCVVFALVGMIAAYFIPRVPPAVSTRQFRFNIAIDTYQTLKAALSNRDFRYPMLAITWFWSLGTVYVSQIPYYAKSILGDEGELVPWLLLAFTVGIAVGAFICSAILRGRISDKTTLPGAIIMALFALDLYFAGGGFVEGDFPVRIVMDLAGIAIGAGLYIVPLYSMLQHRADHAGRGKVIAASNILDALMMSVVSLSSAALIAQGVSITVILLAFGLLSPFVWFVARKVS
jgi:acyl-[acyl-carrier-protein]-phospholipid O-acyltransferase/long-chain-fatty-acid--[acyl-carrier-protein] ligase